MDLDLRYGIGSWAGLTVEPVMNDLALPMCSPDYLDRLSGTGHELPTRLREARLIDSVKTLYRWDFWLAAMRTEVPDVVYPFRFDRSSMSIEMAKQGGGWH